MERKPIPGYEGLYEVTAGGSVLSLVTGKTLRSNPDSKRGYQRTRAMAQIGKKKGKSYAIPPEILKHMAQIVRDCGRSMRSVAMEFGVGAKTFTYQMKHNGGVL